MPLVVLARKQHQKHFLNEIRNVGGVSDPCDRKRRASPLDVLGGDGVTENARFFLTGQRGCSSDTTFP